MDAIEVDTRPDPVQKIRDKDPVAVTVDHQLEDVVEIFSRLNRCWTRIMQADIDLGAVAARNPRWVRDRFQNFEKSEGVWRPGTGVTTNLAPLLRSSPSGPRED